MEPSSSLLTAGISRLASGQLRCFFGWYDLHRQAFDYINPAGLRLLGYAPEARAEQVNPEKHFALQHVFSQPVQSPADFVRDVTLQVLQVTALNGDSWPALLLVAEANRTDGRIPVLLLPLADLDERLQEIARFSAYYKTAIDHATIGIIVCDASGTILLTNRFAREQFCYNEGELEGQPVEVLVPHEQISRHQKHRQHFMQNIQDRPMGIGLDLYGRRKDNSVFPVEISLGHYQTPNGPHIVAFVSDISIRKKNEEALLHQQQVLRKYADEVQRLNAQLEQRVEERTQQLTEAMHQVEQSRQELAEALKKEKELSDLKSRFISMASHEFRTPLSTIQSSIELLEKYVNTSERDKQLRHIRRIHENVRHLTAMLEDFLSVDRLEEGRVTAHRQPMNIRELINGLVEDLQESAKEGPAIQSSHQGPEQVITDVNLLKNVLLNLLGNAVKYTPAGGTITVCSTVNDSQARVSVRDTGVGISEQDLAHLGDRFFRGTNVLHIKGTGLGLHIVQKYLELLGGTLQVHSQLGKGSEFIITIPIN
ncbi:MAG: PAS domain-containing sensor histidine kinase [Chitinophagales bacterium]|nr:PAS domain-containing sensor histidine kinase [Chitinophagales bacterium]MDW8393456.1 PAS domain-containing sensor histidine kinase [Chitinophagales bacterium]